MRAVSERLKDRISGEDMIDHAPKCVRSSVALTYSPVFDSMIGLAWYELIEPAWASALVMPHTSISC